MHYWPINGNGHVGSGQWNVWLVGIVFGVLDFIFDQGPWGNLGSTRVGPKNLVTDQSSLTHPIRLEDFPEDPKVPGSNTFIPNEVLNTSWADWIDHISGVVDSNYYMIIT